MENVLLNEPRQKQPLSLRIPAYIISYIFHPVFIASYVVAFIIFLHPTAFSDTDPYHKLMDWINVFFSTAFLPGFAVFLMWQLKLIPSMALSGQRDRVIPYAVAMIFYFWVWYVAHSRKVGPDYFEQFLLGSFLGVCAAWFLNIVTKVSMHAIGVGGLLVFFFCQAFRDGSGFYFSLSILIAGLVCTARFIVSTHTAREIYVGLFAGIVCQLIALAF